MLEAHLIMPRKWLYLVDTYESYMFKSIKMHFTTSAKCK